jgi:hypothetical protein
MATITTSRPCHRVPVCVAIALAALDSWLLEKTF